MNDWRAAADGLTGVLVVASWLLVTAFPIRYIWHFPHAWYRSFEGRYLVISKSAFSAILGLAVINVLVPHLRNWGGWVFVRVLVYLALVAVFVLLNVMLSRAVTGRRERAKKKLVDS